MFIPKNSLTTVNGCNIVNIDNFTDLFSGGTNMLTWVKGFLFGIIMVCIATTIGLVANIIIEIIRGDGAMVSIYFTTFVIWISEKEALEKLGKIPDRATWDAFCSRVVFYWTPVILGWYIAVNFYSFAFWIGLIISSTFVGYQAIATWRKKQDQWRAFRG